MTIRVSFVGIGLVVLWVVVCRAGEATQAKIVTDPGAIADTLAEIRDIARRHEKRFENLSVKGQWNPNHEAFTLVLQEGKCRHDREVAMPDGSRVTSYWLDDGKVFYSWGGELVLEPSAGSRRKQVEAVAAHLWVYLMPPVHFGAEDLHLTNYTVSEYCDHLMRMIRNASFGRFGFAAELKEGRDQVTIELKQRKPGGVVPWQTSISLDPGKHYVMTRYWERFAADEGADVYSREQEISSEYREVSPGAFFLSKGTWRQKDKGSRLRANGREREGRQTIAIDSVQCGDFGRDEARFDVHKWPPIKLGIRVRDQRVQPALEYVYDKGSFDQSVLEQSLGKERLELARKERIASAIARAFDRPGSVAERLERAIQDAKALYQRVLILLADPESDACRQFYSLYLEDDEAEKAFANYLLLPIDVRKSRDAGTLLTTRFGVKGAGAIPLVWAVDENGKLLATADVKVLSKNERIDREQLIQLLKAHAPELPDAETLLADALARADREGRRVLVEQMGAYCAPCVRLSRLLESQGAILAQDYVLVKIDAYRFPHGNEVINRIRSNRGGGIPWMAILDAKGKVLITSDGPDGNIGCPQEPKDIDHFMKMLTTTARRITHDQLVQLRTNVEHSRAASTTKPASKPTAEAK